MRVAILVVNHQIQPTRTKNMSSDGWAEAFEAGQKECFRKLLCELIGERAVQFIGEEARYGEETIAERESEHLRCRYSNIDMTPLERECRGIPPGYIDMDELSQAEKSRCDREREAYMTDQALLKAEHADSILIICGRRHADPIGTQLIRLGHSVEKIDLQDQGWYVEDWAHHILLNL